MTPACINDISGTAAAMAATVDPYPSSTESLAVDLDGELKRMRYILKKITGYSEWYKHTERLAIPNFNWTTNGDFEHWSAGLTSVPDGWTKVGAGSTIDRETVAIAVRHGTYAAKLTRVDNNTYLQQRVQNIAGFGPIEWWRGKTVTLGAWVRSSTASAARLTLTDGIQTANSAYAPSNSTYTFLTVSLTVDAAATQVEIRLGIDSTNGAAQFDGVVLVVSNDATDYFPSAGGPVGTTFAELGTPSNGTAIYCADCTFANPCAGAGTGAIAKRLNGAWRCD